jgi:putative IMPACT (imprinted ancient) family translation regulator
LGDAAVVITRYFGGTKLGTGGLVRAYGTAVREVLDRAERAVKLPTDVLSVTAPYALFERLDRLVSAHRGQVVGRDFGVDVKVVARFPSHSVSDFERALSEMSNGQLRADVIASGEVSIVPLSQAPGSLA